jgi:WKF domain
MAAQVTRVPAWKKLGLQLKKSLEETKKRPFDQLSQENGDHLGAERSGQIYISRKSTNEHHKAKKRKSVSFSEDTKDDDGNTTEKLLDNYISQNTGEEGFTPDEASAFTTPKAHPANLDKSQSQAKAGTTKRKKSQANSSTRESNCPQYLDYLTSFYTDKANWKFNKKKQSLILRDVFDMSRIPPEYDSPLEAYIRGLESEAARQRLHVRLQAELKELEDENTQREEEKNATSPEPIEIRTSDSEKRQIEEDRESARKRFMFNQKVRRREDRDREEAETPEFKARLAKRKRSEIMLRALQGYLSNDVEPETEALRIDTPANVNRLLGPYNPAYYSSNSNDNELPAKKQLLRRKVIPTGLPDDDIKSISSASSVNSEPSESLSESAASDDDNDSEDSGTSGSEGTSSSSGRPSSSDANSDSSDSDSRTGSQSSSDSESSSDDSN